MKKSKIRKPWGYFQVLDNKKVYKVKKIFVKPAGKLSLQSHKYRSENWVVIEGIAKVVLEKNGLKKTVKWKYADVLVKDGWSLVN